VPDRATIEAATPHCAVVHDDGGVAIPCGAPLALDDESGLWVCTDCGYVTTPGDAATLVELRRAGGAT
jgi:hypothetical protein